MADPRHRRDAPPRPKHRAKFATATVAALATGTAIVSGVAMTPQSESVLPVVSAGADVAPELAPAPTAERQPVISRAETRYTPPRPTRLERALAAPATRRAVSEADAKRWTTEVLNVWTQPGEDGRKVGLLDELTRVVVTGRSLRGRDEVVLDGRSRWVTAGFLARHKPAEDPEPGAAVEEATLGGTCSNGSSVPAGVSANIAAVHEAVCAAFPEITSYGTLRADGEHAQGIAVDIMVSGARGWQVAEFVRANSAELGVSYAIHARNIWSVQRSGEGWRGMEDRGSATANHFDHVHVTTF